MKLKKTLGLTVAATAIAASASFAPVASAEVSASVGIASQYLWRGIDLGYGSAAVYGDLTYTAGGFHGGIWASSGDDGFGHEYDLILGYGGEAGSFSYDVSLVSYVYPSGAGINGDTDLGEFVDLVIGLGFGPVSFTYYQTVEGEDQAWADEDYFYANLGYAISDQFSVSVGMHDEGLFGSTLAAGDSPVHVQFDYAYNDNLTFTASKMVAGEDTIEKDMQVVVSYSLPIE